MWTRSELKERAKRNLHESYWGLVIAGLIMAFTTGGSSGGNGASSGSVSDLTSGAGSLDSAVAMKMVMIFLAVLLFCMAFSFAFTAFFTGPLQVGAERYMMNAAYAPQTVSGLKVVGMAFKSGCYMNVVKIMFLRTLYIWLWSLLFIVPGIIKAYEYRMIPYLLAENPNMTKEEAFALSKQMMDGEKMNAWVLDLSFIGWGLLSLCTCGLLGVFYVNPYYQMTAAHLYLTLRSKVSFIGDGYQTSEGAYGNAAYGDSSYGNASYGNSYYGNASGNASYGNSSYGNDSFGGYPSSAQQPSGYDAYGKPVYGQHAAAQQPAYGYDYSKQNVSGSQGSSAGAGYDGGQNNGYNPYQNPGNGAGYDGGQNNGYNPYQDPGNGAGYGTDQNNGYDPYQNPTGFGSDPGMDMNFGFGYDPNMDSVTGFGYDTNMDSGSGNGYDPNSDTGNNG